MITLVAISRGQGADKMCPGLQTHNRHGKS